MGKYLLTKRAKSYIHIYLVKEGLKDIIYILLMLLNKASQMTSF